MLLCSTCALNLCLQKLCRKIAFSDRFKLKIFFHRIRSGKRILVQKVWKKMVKLSFVTRSAYTSYSPPCVVAGKCCYMLGSNILNIEDLKGWVNIKSDRWNFFNIISNVLWYVFMVCCNFNSKFVFFFCIYPKAITRYIGIELHGLREKIV